MDASIQSPADALKAKGRALIRQQALVGGTWVDGNGVIEVDDPAEETVIGSVPRLSGAQVDAAIDAAERAFAEYAAWTPIRRAEFLARWAALIDSHAEDIGALISLENGKPFAEGVGEARYANAFIKWFAGEAERVTGGVIKTSTGDTVLTFREPVGPVAAITPWNFPAAMLTRKAGAAFAAGCTLVAKPASATPFTTLALAALALEAGLPEGAFNVVTGEQAVVGGALLGSAKIRKLSFTGSTEVGRKLAAQAAPTLKRLSMELGGAAPLIVFEDADVATAVEGTVRGKFRAGGQTCVCPNRIYAHRRVKDAYLEQLTAAVQALKVAKPFEEGAQVGPLINQAGVEKVEDHVARVEAAGGKVLTGGHRHNLGGRFFQPTVTDGGDDALFREEETFGPLAPVFVFDDEADVIARANASDYGLAAFLFTRDLDRAMRVGQALEAGVIGVNAGLVSNAAAPFGGVKQSGFGSEGSIYGIEDYVKVRAMTIARGAG
ncbi:MAG TPA: NAD-dependent succinate-semialdehyde dehydrogenase [Caulobacteraceae bacterium]|nr:NAD-dependent succinate-semialdehyde dehydrogenase [Caulobacteraceae bacterium]